jgi:hypothetical protein
MAERKPQTYENHARFVPTYHFVTFGILVINLGWSIWALIAAPSGGGVVALLLAVALLLLFFHVRIFPLTVQDRVIRLEMRLHLAEVLPDDLRRRIGELTSGQMVALRFAGDGELPDLVRRVLAGEFTSRKAIKQEIKDWQGDYLRC